MSDVLAIAEHRQGELQDVSYQAVSAASDLAGEGGAVELAVIGGDVDGFAESLQLRGVDVVHTVDDGDEFNHDVYVQAVEQLVREGDPDYVLMPHSVNGWDYAPAVANRLELPLMTDAIDFEFGDDLTVVREMYESKVEARFRLNADRAALTFRPGEWDAVEEPGDAPVEAFDVSIDEDRVGSRVAGFEEAAAGDVDISEAEFIISIGRGIEEEENLDIIRELCDAAGATLGSSRPITDNGWLPKNRQVGQSGKVVTPDVYVAIGISGAVQHVAGMKGSDTIVAINTDPDAPIFDIADYGVVGDLFEVVPALTERMKNGA